MLSLSRNVQKWAIQAVVKQSETWYGLKIAKAEPLTLLPVTLFGFTLKQTLASANCADSVAQLLAFHFKV